MLLQSSEKRKWVFRKKGTPIHQQKTEPLEQRHAIEAAEAAVAAAKAAVDMIRLRNPSDAAASFKLHYAAKLIQTTFRGYLARKALLALKGIVKLQALIRGQNVRRQAAKTMKCMQSLLRVQSMVREHRNRLSHDGGRRSLFAEASDFWDYTNNFNHRNAVSRNGSLIAHDWGIKFPRSLQELEAIFKYRNEAAAANPTIKTVEMDEDCSRSQCPSPVHWRSVLTSRARTPRLSASRSMANTPSLRSTQQRISSCISRNEDQEMLPSYMAPTESAKARIRSQSVPRQRESTPERERSCSARRRLQYHVPEAQPPHCVSKVKSPASFKSLRQVEDEKWMYSCYARSAAGETSHSSCSTELRGFLM